MEYITCMDEVLVNDKYFYLSHAGYNSLFRMDKESLQTEWLGLFPQVDICKERIHRRVFCYQEHLFFFPLSGRYLHIYNLKDKTMECVQVVRQQKGIKGLVAEVICFHHVAYIFPSHSNQPLYIFDFETFKLTECIKWNQKIEHLLRKQNFVMDLFSIIRDGENLWISIFGENVIVKMNLETWNLEKYQLEKAVKLRNITKSGDKIYATLADSTSIFCWNLITNEERILESPLSTELPRPFMTVISAENKLFVIPEAPVPIQIVDEREGEISIIENYSKYYGRVSKGAMYASVQLLDNKLWCFPRASTHLLSIDLDSLKLHEHRIEAPDSTDFQEFIRKKNLQLLQKSQFHEEDNMGKSLNFFLYMVGQKERVEKKKTHGDLVGNRIWKETVHF